jgi:class 3 adenylate cyclase
MNHASGMRRCLLLLLPLLWGASLSAQSVTQGGLDLSHWSDPRPVVLDGAWKFWFESLPGKGTPILLGVPGTWTAAQGRPDGWGTYQLTVQLPDPPPANLALSVPLIGAAGEVVWNGKSVLKIGEWNPGNFQPRRQTAVVEVPARAGPNDLQIRVGSYGDVNPGLIESLWFGPTLALVEKRNSDILVAVALFCSLCIMGIYHLAIFAFRPKDQSALWFGVLAILFSLRGVLSGSTFFADLFPWMPWEPEMKLWYWTFATAALSFSLFIAALFPQVTPKWFRPMAVVGGGGYTLLILVATAAWYTRLLLGFSLFVGVLGLVVLWILGRAVWKRLTGSVLFLMGFIVLFGTVVNDLLKSNILLPTPFLGSIGLVAFLVFQSLVLIKKFSVAYSDSERYSQHLAQINVSLERFIPKEILGYLDRRSIVDIELGDFSERPMVVLFSDIRDFTSLSETMTPQQNFKFINSYLRRMGPVIRKHGGFVDKYLGDGIMALFPRNPSDAVHAALEMRQALAEYNVDRAKAGYQPVRVGIGLHWGELMLGTIGENQRMDSTVISDTVNTASRLEGLTKLLGTDILLSGQTLAALDPTTLGLFDFQFLSEQTVKGRQEPIQVYSVVGRMDSATRLTH